MTDRPKRSASDLEKRKAEYQQMEKSRQLNEDIRVEWVQKMIEEKNKGVQDLQACKSAGIPVIYLEEVWEMNKTIRGILHNHDIGATTRVNELMGRLEKMEEYEEIKNGIEASKATKNPDGTEKQHQIPVPRMTSQDLKKRFARDRENRMNGIWPDSTWRPIS